MTAPVLSDRIRDELRDEIGPCPTCHNPRMTIAALSKHLDQPESTVGRYLSGAKPSVSLLDSAEGWLAERAEAVVAPLLRRFYATPLPAAITATAEPNGIPIEDDLHVDLGDPGA